MKNFKINTLLFAIIFSGLISCQRKMRPTAFYGYLISEPKAIKYGGINAFAIFNPCLGRPNYDHYSHPPLWDDVTDVSNRNGNVERYIDVINKKGGIYIVDSYPLRYAKTKIPFKGTVCGYYFESDDKLVLVQVSDLPSFMISSEEEKTFLVNVTNNDKPLQSRILLQYEDRKELEAYNEANRRNTVQGCREFLAKYPNSKYKNNVNVLIATLEPIETAKREAEIAAAKREEERKKAIILEKGPDFVISKGVMGKYRVFNGMPTGGKSIEFADGTSGSIYDIDGYYSIAEILPFRNNIYKYENEDYAIKALYKYKKGMGIPSEGRYYGSVSSKPASSSSSSSSSDNDDSDDNEKSTKKSDSKIDYESVRHPGVEEEDSWKGPSSSFVHGTYYTKAIEFKDGIKGNLFKDKEGLYFIDTITSFREFKNFQDALNALYVLKKHGVLVKSKK